MLDPGDQVVAGGVGDKLEWAAVGCQQVWVAGRVEEVEESLVVLDDAAGVGVEVRGAGAAGREHFAVLLVMD